jgi:transcriptional regulator with XRE-family HTH domain
MSRKATGEKNLKMGERIKQLRDEKELTQEQVGAVIGVQRSAVRKYEKGEVVNMPISSIKKLAEFFQVQPTYLMGWSEEKGLIATQGGGGEHMEDISIICEQLKFAFGESVMSLLNSFFNLNDDGKEKAITQIQELNRLPKYAAVQDGTTSVQDE